MVDRLIQIASINSGTSNQDGVARVAEIVAGWFDEISERVDRVPMPDVESVNDLGELLQRSFANAVVARRRVNAKHRVLLSIHLDTVYGPEHSFQDVWHESENVLRGPGVADAKGGLVVLIEGLRRFESALAESELTDCDVGWTAVLTPDEEIGSISSSPFLHEVAQEADIGLVYEPTLPDGTLIESRKGSGNFAVVVRGRSAHAGREIQRRPRLSRRAFQRPRPRSRDHARNGVGHRVVD